MNNIVVFAAALLAVVLSGPVPEDNDNRHELVGKILHTTEAESTTKESNVTYWFFSIEDPSNGIPIKIESIDDLANTPYNSSRDTIFIVHGWHNTLDSPFITTVRSAIIKNLNVNLFVVDWTETASLGYIAARYSIAEIGKSLGDFIQTLVSTYNLSLSKTTLVGHSLGGHVVGNAGATLDGNVSVIVGLDPAFPLFIISNDRLNTSNAKYVQVIHTNGGLKGYLTPIGHSDYFPNGGTRQLGCGTDVTGTCAHARAFEYYAESLGGGRFVGVSCGSYKEFSNGSCTSGSSSVMGTSTVDTRASGRYYLNTNSESPYAQG